MTAIQPITDDETLIDGPIRTALAALYRGEGRFYHGLPHIEALLALAGHDRNLIGDYTAFEAAIWFHDAVYDSRAKDNETKSAALARQQLAGRTDAARIERIAAMIEATATHRVPSLGDAAAERDAALLLDMDLSILGAAPATFDAYEQAVRREYAWVDEAAWRAGRAAVLKGFLARAHIFHTPEFQARFEGQARDNIERSLKALGA